MNSKLPGGTGGDVAVRLQAYLARAGVASRRASERLIAAGRVSVNGAVVTEMGAKTLPGDIVCVDGQPARPESRRHYIALNKPPLYLCSAGDAENRPLAGDLLPPEIQERLYSIGRLDYRSRGLILFTNDGMFASKLGHPSSNIEKEYIIEASGAIDGGVADSFLAGIEIEGTLYRAIEIERLGRKALRVVLIEGKNRELRRVFSHFRLHPVSLRRIRIGPVRLGDLAEGRSRPLSAAELEALDRSVLRPAVTRSQK
ncbi:MAG: rRNA pseudouridine synthase [Spirochaetaceae bacterium]|nr:rRNA pseudouridine synthase [Spirochaetaceae bacterium]